MEIFTAALLDFNPMSKNDNWIQLFCTLSYHCKSVNRAVKRRHGFLGTIIKYFLRKDGYKFEFMCNRCWQIGRSFIVHHPSKLYGDGRYKITLVIFFNFVYESCLKLPSFPVCVSHHLPQNLSSASKLKTQ